MAAEIADAKKKTAYAQFGTAMAKYVLGPLIVALGIGGYATTNHKESAAGYEVLAKALNHEVMDKLEALEKRVTKLEAPATQPTSAPATQPVVKVVKLPIAAKAPIGVKAPTKAPPVAKAPVRVPAKMDLKVTPASMPVKLAPPAPKAAPKMMKRVPDRLEQIKF
jgi:hypothetical protein